MPNKENVKRGPSSSLQPQQILPSLEQMLAKSESEDTSNGTTGRQQQQQLVLEKQNSVLSNYSGGGMSSNTTIYSSLLGSRLDDEDPVFSLDEDVQAKEKSGERTRHYTADFDPTASDDDFDEFPKDVGNLHGGRAYSASQRFPPRIRHSGRSGQNTGVIHPKLQHQFSLGRSSAPVPASLPIAIAREFNWPPHELVGSLSEEEEKESSATDKQSAKERQRAKTTMVNHPVTEQQKGQLMEKEKDSEIVGSDREDDMYGRIRAYSRSIQPADDPERLFGERPRRRMTMKGEEGTVAENGYSGGENVPPPSSLISMSIPAAVVHDLNSQPPQQQQTGADGAATGPRVIVPSSLLNA